MRQTWAALLSAIKCLGRCVAFSTVLCLECRSYKSLHQRNAPPLTPSYLDEDPSCLAMSSAVSKMGHTLAMQPRKLVCRNALFDARVPLSGTAESQ